MHSLRSVKRIKELWHTTATGQQLTVAVPEDLNQSLLKRVNLNEYIVSIMTAERELAESEVTTLSSKGDIVGFLIPGQAILSPNHPKNDNALFGTYSLIAALTVLDNAKNGDSMLSQHPATNSVLELFSPGFFYAVIWTKKLDIKPQEFHQRYFTSFARMGIYQTTEFKKNIKTTRTLASYDIKMPLNKNKDWPDYVSIIATKLSPYATDPYLRFFYLYQIVETLMAENYAEQQATIRIRFDKCPTPSITELKDFLKEFNSIVNEAPRINNSLEPGSVESIQSANSILEKLGVDYTGWAFGAKIYKIRNVIFHDYKKIFHIPLEVSTLEDHLMSYLLNNKLS